MSAGRNARFVRTAKRLLLFQAGAAALAVGLAGWAALEVSGVVRERDALAARVRQLEAQPSIGTGAYPPVYEPDAPPPADAATPAAPTQPAQAQTGTTPQPAPAPGPTRAQPPSPTPAPAPPPAPTPTPPPAPPPAPTPPAPPAPPSPPRDCQSVQRQPIVCAPPFRRTPVPGVCVDRNNRPMRCPPGTPRTPRDQTPTNDQQQPSPTGR